MRDIIVHIGFHKTGTTWLQKIYFENQKAFNLITDYRKPWKDDLCIQVINASDKDFAPGICRKIIKSQENRDKVNVLSVERFSGHPISGGFDAIKIASRLYTIDPNFKVIIVRRNEREFIASVYKQMVREGYCGTFKDFLTKPQWKTAGPSKTYFGQETLIETYREKFGEKNILVLEFEDFKRDKRRFFNELNKFTGLEIFEISDAELKTIVNKSYSNSRLKALRKLNRIRKTEYNPYPIIGLSSGFIRKLSYLSSYLFNNLEVIDEEILDEYLR